MSEGGDVRKTVVTWGEHVSAQLSVCFLIRCAVTTCKSTAPALVSALPPPPSPLYISMCVPVCSASGQSSQERKKGLISKLIVASKGSEPGYIIRSLQVGAGVFEGRGTSYTQPADESGGGVFGGPSGGASV